MCTSQNGNWAGLSDARCAVPGSTSSPACCWALAWGSRWLRCFAAPSSLYLACSVVTGCLRLRQVLGGLLAGVVAIAAPRANAIDIIDGTKLRQSGFDIIYNARDLDKSQVHITGTINCVDICNA